MPHGVGMMTIKGERRLKKILASGVSAAESRIAAVPCSCAEQAEALRLHIASGHIDGDRTFH
jgi:hypothetical protein